MRTVFEEDKSEAVVAGEYEECELMQQFSLKNVTSEERKEQRSKSFDTWKRKRRAWEKLNVLRSKEEKTFADEKVKYEKNYGLYDPSRPPFPGSDVTIQSMLDTLAPKEYIDKPYDCEALTELLEMNQRLKSSVMVYSRNSVGLGIDFRPTNHREVAALSPEELEAYKKQGKELMAWYNNRVEQGKNFSQIAYEVMYGKSGLGEGYFEVVDTVKGSIKQIAAMSPVYIWEAANRDKYIWIKNGRKKYFKRFNDKAPRSIDDFGKPTAIEKYATRLLPFREYNLVSDVYGVAAWTGAIPQVIGGRYASERNVNLFLNDATPRMAVLVAGGAVDVETKNTLKSFFQKGKGRANAGRVLLLCVSSKNTLSPSAKPPTVTLEPLTIGKTEDGSFMAYSAGCDETIREAFRIALTFYGTAGDSNRASSYTLRDQTVSMVNKPEAEMMAFLCNDTFTHEWAVEKGLRKVDTNGEIVEDKLLAEIYFITPTTMSEKDSKEIHIQELVSGALTINNYRSQIGLEEIPKWWADLPRTLAVTALQMAAIAPAIITTMTDRNEFDASVMATAVSGAAETALVTSTDETTKALAQIRQALNSVLKHNHVGHDTLGMLDKMFTMVKGVNEDDEWLHRSLKVENE